MDELISVIVPVYNVEKYLERCVDSIRKQTYSNIEILLVDDGSTDSCYEIIKRLEKEDPRIRSFHQENGGLSAARNTGIDNAKGEYIAFVDSDDYIHPRMLEILYSNLIDFRADLSICDLYWIHDGEETKEYVENNTHVFEGIDVLHRLIGDELVSVVAWNKLYKASIFKKLRYPIGKLHEDEYILHEVYSQCLRTVYTDAKLYYYIKRQGSISDKLVLRNLYDAEDAFCRRFLWSIKNADKVFSNSCFDAMLGGANCVLRYKESVDNDMCISDIRRQVRESLDSVGFSRNITWRKLIIGRLWLWNPEFANNFRKYLHC